MIGANFSAMMVASILISSCSAPNGVDAESPVSREERDHEESIGSIVCSSPEVDPRSWNPFVHLYHFEHHELIENVARIKCLTTDICPSHLTELIPSELIYISRCSAPIREFINYLQGHYVGEARLINIEESIAIIGLFEWFAHLHEPYYSPGYFLSSLVGFCSIVPEKIREECATRLSPYMP